MATRLNMNSPKVSLQYNRVLIFLIIFLLLLLYFIDSYRGWSIMLISFGGSWMISFIWAKALSKGLSLQREMRFGWAQVGDRLEERFTLLNQSRFPAIWVEIWDESNMPNYWANQVRGIGSNSETRWYVQSVCSRRGIYIFGPTKLRTKDPLGFFTVTIEDPTSLTMVVMPPVVSLPSIRVAPGGRAGEGATRIDAPERTVSSSSVRQYVPGDSFRWIHWPTTAKRGDYYVRIFDGAPSGDWWIILDLDQNVQVGEGQDSTIEHGIILAASLADLAMRNGKSVGLVAHGKDLVWLAPNMSDEHNWKILKSLAIIEPGDCSLSALLKIVRKSLSKNSTAIIITPNSGGEWIQHIFEIRNQQVVPTLLLFDPETFGGTSSIMPLRQDLINYGIGSEAIPKSMLEQGEIQPGKAGHWEWMVTPLGRAVPVIDPDTLTWRNMSGHSSKFHK